MVDHKIDMVLLINVTMFVIVASGILDRQFDNKVSFLILTKLAIIFWKKDPEFVIKPPLNFQNFTINIRFDRLLIVMSQ